MPSNKDGSNFSFSGSQYLSQSLDHDSRHPVEHALAARAGRDGSLVVYRATEEFRCPSATRRSEVHQPFLWPGGTGGAGCRGELERVDCGEPWCVLWTLSPSPGHGAGTGRRA